MRINHNPNFKHIISLGYFCNIALELERKGRRDASYPFDWVITDIPSVYQLLKNRFEDLFNKELLFRNAKYPYIIQHKKYKFDFYHDFDPNKSIDQQINVVALKYGKRIERLYQNMKQPSLFIRYIENNEAEFWYEEAKSLMSFIKSFNEENSFILIANEGVELDTSKIIDGVIKVFFIEKDINDIVARRILKNNKSIKDFVLNIQYPLFTKMKNYFIYYKKMLNKLLIKKIVHKF